MSGSIASGLTTPATSALGDLLTESEAKRLTTRIQLRLGTIADNVEAVVPMIEEAHNGEAHVALGYPSWTKYVADEFGGMLSTLRKADRLPFVELMSDQGMGLRAIASVVGTSHQTVANDLASAGVKNLTPNATEEESTSDEPEIISIIPKTTTGTTIGMDGRTYKRSEPKPRQRPFADDYRDRVEKMQNGVMNLYDLHKDDRFNKNREAVRAYAGYLVACARDLCDLLDDLGIDYNLYGGPVRMTTEEAAAALDDLSNSGAR